MNSFTPFLAPYNELVDQWQKILGILRDMEEKAVESPEILRLISVFKSSCNEFQSFQAKLDYFSAEPSSNDLDNHWQELSSDFNKIRACSAALVQSIHNHHKSQEMAKSNSVSPVTPRSSSGSFADSQDIKFNMAEMEGSSFIRRIPKSLIVAFPDRSTSASILTKGRKSRIIRKQAGLIVVFRVSKEYLRLNARPQVNMEEEMRLSVLRWKKAEEEEAKKKAKAAIEAARTLAIEQAKATIEAARVSAFEQVSVENQQAINPPPFDFDNPHTWEKCNRAIMDDGMPLPMPKDQHPSMEEIRQALITTTKQMFLSDKTKVKASTVKNRVKNELQLERFFFRKNGWEERADLIIVTAFRGAWHSDLLGYEI